MKHIYILALFTFASFVQAQQPPRVVDLKSSDATLLKASYFAAAKPGPGVLLFHQSNRDRKSWDAVARQLAAAGINVLTVDSRGHGESAGNTEAVRSSIAAAWPDGPRSDRTRRPAPVCLRSRPEDIGRHHS